MDPVYCLLIFGISVVTGLFSLKFLPFIIEGASQSRILDYPDKRKIHLKPIPRLGGTAIAPAIWLGCAMALVLSESMDLSGGSSSDSSFSSVVTGLLLGCTGSFILGFYDDLRHIKAIYKLVFQIVIAAVVINFLPPVTSIFGYAVPAWFSTILAFGWLIVLPNSVNLLDGVDGLTGGLIISFLFVCSLLAGLSGQYGWLAITLPSMAAVGAFLSFNWHPAKIFLGDSGSLTLGFMISYLSLVASTFTDTVQDANPAILLSLTSVWWMDTGYAILRRYLGNAPKLRMLLRQSGIGLFGVGQFRAIRAIIEPDKRHLHHMLLALGLRPRMVVAIMCCTWFSIFLISFRIFDTTLVNAENYHRWLEPMILGPAGLMIAFVGATLVIRARKPMIESVNAEPAKSLVA